MPSRKRIRPLKRQVASIFSKKGMNAAAAARRWLTQNRAAIDAYNAHVERDGVFSDRLRLF
jgi:post-segregation antitoxin (ccd killing protein)